MWFDTGQKIKYEQAISWVDGCVGSSHRTVICVCVCVWCSKLLVIDFNKVATHTLCTKWRKHTYSTGLSHQVNVDISLSSSICLHFLKIFLHPIFFWLLIKPDRFWCAQYSMVQLQFQVSICQAWTNPFSMFHNLFVIRIASKFVWQI